MRINRGETTNGARVEAPQSRPTSQVSENNATLPQTTTGLTGSDSVALNDLSSLSELAFSAGASERAGQVQQLKQSVSNGQYVIDPEAVSRALIRAHMAGE